MPPSTEPLENDAGGESDTDQLSVWPKNESVGLARAMTVPPTRVELAALFPGRSTSLNVGCFNSAETFNGHPPIGPCLTPGKRVSTPNKRVDRPHLKIAREFDVLHSPSDADTEVSENFGQKLKRYRRVEEEDKENDSWWTDSVSYG
jgi:hypothetical protein